MRGETGKSLMHGECSRGKYRLRTARGNDELEAVFRFRYEHFFHGVTDGYPGLDRVHARLFEPHDLESTHFCAFDSDGQLCAVSTATPAAEPGIPSSWKQWLQLDGSLFPRSDGIVISTRLVIHPHHRHNGLFDLFYRFIMKNYLETGYRYALHYCSPGLLCRYEALGHRPYGEAFVVPPGLVRVSMFMDLADVRYLRHLNPPLADLCTAHAAPADVGPPTTLPLLSGPHPNFQLLTPWERLDFVMTRLGRDLLPESLDISPVLEYASPLHLKAGLSHTASTSGSFLFLVLSGTVKRIGTDRISGPGAFIGTASPPAPFTVVSDALVLAFDYNLVRAVSGTVTGPDAASPWQSLCAAGDRLSSMHKARASGNRETM